MERHWDIYWPRGAWAFPLRFFSRLYASILQHTFVGLLLLEGAIQYADAEVCRNPKSLAELVYDSDAVAIIEEVRPRQGGVDAILNSVVRVPVQYFKFNEVIKPPLVQADTIGTQVIYSTKRRPLAGTSFTSQLPPRYVVFLSAVGRREWTPLPCAQLTLSNGNYVLDACGAISDLLGEKRWERERCLVDLPPGASLDQVKGELKRYLFDQRAFSGAARFASTLRWAPSAPFQPVLLEMDSKTKRDFLDVKAVHEMSPVRVFLNSSAFAPRDLQNRATAGTRIEFQGNWQQGNFVIESIEWGYGRRPRSP